MDPHPKPLSAKRHIANLALRLDELDDRFPLGKHAHREGPRIDHARRRDHEPEVIPVELDRFRLIS